MEYALHETLEVHEIAAFKALCLTKTKTMRALVSDEELKQLMELDAEMSTRHIEELKEILSRANQ
ncbi:MAG TPA: hypothetical protein VE710_18095 [Candidatus Bathyarchaeia archaeon]|nr:hypothetical protein [Candidatus Bathyarchaeia archaeon]